MPYRRILLATDRSPSADQVGAVAHTLARRDGAALHVLHVNVLSAEHLNYRGLSGIEAYAQHMVEACRNTLEDFQDEPGISLVRAVRNDQSPANAIVEYAEEEAVDLIVVGSRGLSAVKRFLLGSVASKVVHAAPCSVLVAGQDDEQDATNMPQCIVATTDLSRASASGLHQADALAQAHGARLCIVHVMVPPMVDPYDAEIIARQLDESQGRRALADFVAGLDLKTSAEQLVVVGLADQEIAAAAQARKADLVVVSNTGMSAIGRLLLGSVADKVVRNAHCPVLVHRPATEH
ncbi:MAG: universal stress protein [Algiphilus sp.]